MNAKKLIYTILFSQVLLFAGFGQESNIELPDLTTEVKGETAAFEEAEIPDFNTVVVLPQDSSDIVPELPNAEAEFPEKNILDVIRNHQDKQIYANGQIGGGYPATFIGDFDVSRIAGNNPFKIGFDHRSSSGFSGNDLSSGYNTEYTKIELERKSLGKNFNWSASGYYEDSGNGFQSKVPGISSANQQEIFGVGSVEWKLPLGFNIFAGGYSSFYNRYLDISDSGITCDEWARKADLLSVYPFASVTWSVQDKKENHYSVDFFPSYYLLADLTDRITGTAVNRGEFRLCFHWDNKALYTSADVAAVIGNYIGNNKVLVPFDLKFGGTIASALSSRPLTFNIAGGLQTFGSSIVEKEKNYKYSAFSFIPEETSDWYGKVNFALPVKDFLSVNTAVDFMKTAFGNGVWEPLYKGTSTAGLYCYEKTDRTILSTDFGVSYHYKMFSAAAKFKSNWLDIPVLENKHTLLVDLSLQSEKGKWGADLETGIHFGAKDFTPMINASGFVQLTPAVKLVVSVDDFCRLIDMEDRIYAGDYICESGSVTMLVKFLF
ncbi:MAG: hypothetical protein MJ162_00875 [Treponema sp.]|nr:hypothetical protein [Treponema sp.]